LTTWNPDGLRAARVAKGWTLGQLAATADVTYAALVAYAGGHSAPPPQVLVRLARVLDVDTTDLAPLSAAPTLHELRWHAGLGLQALADEVGLTREYVARICRGETAIRNLEVWATALHASPGQVRAAWDATHAALHQRL
jgi:transcriptional regulator with XRE-family HTH domain